MLSNISCNKRPRSETPDIEGRPSEKRVAGPSNQASSASSLVKPDGTGLPVVIHKKSLDKTPFMNLPFDAVNEIFSFCDTRDLANFCSIDKWAWEYLSKEQVLWSNILKRCFAVYEPTRLPPQQLCYNMTQGLFEKREAIAPAGFPFIFPQLTSIEVPLANRRGPFDERYTRDCEGCFLNNDYFLKYASTFNQPAKLEIWDLKTGKIKFRFSARALPNINLLNCGYHNNRLLLYSMNFGFLSIIWVLDLNTGQELQALLNISNIQSVSVSDNYYVIIRHNQPILAYNMVGFPIDLPNRIIPFEQFNDRGIQGVALLESDRLWDRDESDIADCDPIPVHFCKGNKLILGKLDALDDDTGPERISSYHTLFYAWDLVTGQPVGCDWADKDFAEYYFSDGNNYFIGQLEDSGDLIVYDTRTRKYIQTFVGGRKRYATVEVYPASDPQLLICVEKFQFNRTPQSTVYYWDIKTASLVKEYSVNDYRRSPYDHFRFDMEVFSTIRNNMLVIGTSPFKMHESKVYATVLELGCIFIDIPSGKQVCFGERSLRFSNDTNEWHSPDHEDGLLRILDFDVNNSSKVGKELSLPLSSKPSRGLSASSTLPTDMDLSASSILPTDMDTSD